METPAFAPKWSELGAHFADADLSRELLERMRWPNGVACPRCGGSDPYKITPKAGSKTRKGVYKCSACRKQFTVTVGTVFEDTHIPLNKWMQAIYLLCSSKKGISAHQLHRMLGITYKSAWFMAHRLRYAMTQTPLVEKLNGVVEADETYVGGKFKFRNYKKNEDGSYTTTPGRRGFRGENKIPVVALVERGGRVRAFPMPRVTAENVQEAIIENCHQDAVLMTDESSLYTVIGKQMAGHETVKHSLNEYVRGQAHTNTVEGFFSLLKRGITGVYHHVGKGHVGRYVDEFVFRYDRRKVTDGQRAVMAVMGAEGKRLTYKQPA